jgi:hypothetical protein
VIFSFLAWGANKLKLLEFGKFVQTLKIPIYLALVM